jgi:glucosamine--fructose-6-phosphate aminotransferase (isomerizing)
MCGICGATGLRHATPIVFEGLRRLEYRGYDSAGIATLADGKIERRRAAGKLDNLAALLEREPLSGTTGIGHTRWATHGAPTTGNAHPHGTARVAIVHNGIIENFETLRRELETAGQVFETETDSENHCPVGRLPPPAWPVAQRGGSCDAAKAGRRIRRRHGVCRA